MRVHRPYIAFVRLEKGSSEANSEDTGHGTLSGSCTRVLAGGSVITAGALAGARNGTRAGTRDCAGSTTDAAGGRAGGVRCS